MNARPEKPKKDDDKISIFQGTRLAKSVRSFRLNCFSCFIRVLVAMVLVSKIALVKLDASVKVTAASVRQGSLDPAAVKVIGT